MNRPLPTARKTPLAQDQLHARYIPRCHERTVYVSATGSDRTGDGTKEAPFRQLAYAAQTVLGSDRQQRTKTTFLVGPGNYNGSVSFQPDRGYHKGDSILVSGSVDRDGLPSTHLSIEEGNGITVSNGLNLTVCSLHISGEFDIAIHGKSEVTCEFFNIHIDGQGKGHRGITIERRSGYLISNCLIENCTYAGIDEYFLVNRSFSEKVDSDERVVIRGCQIGLRAKEGCVGHLDWLKVEDCSTGIELIQNSVANTKAVTLNRNQVGLALVNSTAHNEGGIRWGEGPDANTREVYSAGASGELRALMWTGEEMPRMSNAGHRPLFSIANAYQIQPLLGVSGTTIEAIRFSQIIPRPFFRTCGKHFYTQLWVSTTGVTQKNPLKIILRFGNTKLCSVILVESGTAKVDFDTVCVEEGVELMTLGRVVGTRSKGPVIQKNRTAIAGDPSGVGTLAIDLRSEDKQEIKFHLAEVFG